MRDDQEKRLRACEIAIQGDIRAGTTGLNAFAKNAGDDIYGEAGVLKTLEWHKRIFWMGGGIMALITLAMSFLAIYLAWLALNKPNG